MEPEGVIKEGYKLFSQRVQQFCSDFTSTFHYSEDEPKKIISNLEHMLQTIEQDGIFSPSNEIILSDALGLIKQSIPQTYGVYTPEACLQIAGRIASQFMDIEYDTFPEYLRISEFIPSSASGLTLNEKGDGYQVMMNFNEHDKESSVISLLQTFLLIPNRYFNDLITQRNLRQEIPGFTKLQEAISQQQTLEEERIEYVKKGMELLFYSAPKVMDLAKRNMVDYGKWAEYLSIEIPRSLFNQSMMCGSVPLMSISAITTFIPEPHPLKTIYSTIASLECLQMPFVAQKNFMSLLGVGLASYNFENGDKSEELHSIEFARKFADTYFTMETMVEGN